MTGKETVKQAVAFANPDRVPLLYNNRDIEESDVLYLGFHEAADFAPKVEGQSEWGFVWETKDGTMGQPKYHPLTDWSLWEDYKKRMPDPYAKGRYDHVPAFLAAHPDRYVMGSMGLSGFNLVTFIRGFEDTLMDLYADRERIEELIDAVFDFESELIRQFCTYDGVDAICFGDDWGTQETLMISPALWREVFKPRYAKQFAIAKAAGKRIYFHCCGQIRDIIGDFIEIGVDILNLNQPDIFPVEYLAEHFAGKVTFNCPADHQNVALKGMPAELYAYIHKLNDLLGSHGGGFIGYIEDYACLGMPEENYQAIKAAFKGLKPHHI